MVLFDLDYYNKPLSFYFEEKYGKVFFALCNSGDIAGKEKVRELKKYHHFISNYKN